MTLTYLLDVAERAAKTFAQVFIATLIAGGVGTAGVDVLSVAQQAALAGLAAVLSVVSSVLSAPFGPSGSPSLAPLPAAPQHAAPSAPADPPVLGGPGIDPATISGPAARVLADPAITEDTVR